MEINRGIEVCVVIENGTLDRNIGFTLSMIEDNATADVDYTQEDFQLNLGPSLGEVCADILVTFDDVVEATEVFSILLQTNDRSVDIESGRQMITIVDSSMVNVRFVQDEYDLMEGENINVCIVLVGMIDRIVDASIEAVNGGKFSLKSSHFIIILLPDYVLQLFFSLSKI